MNTPVEALPPRCLVERKTLPQRGIHRSPVTLWRWEKAGRLTPIRIANHVYYDEAQVNALLENGDGEKPHVPILTPESDA